MSRSKYVRFTILMLPVLVLAACEQEKSASPTSPSVAGPIAGVTISAPKLLQPASGAQVSFEQQPITLMVGNSTSTGVRALSYVFESPRIRHSRPRSFRRPAWRRGAADRRASGCRSRSAPIARTSGARTPRTARTPATTPRRRASRSSRPSSSIRPGRRRRRMARRSRRSSRSSPSPTRPTLAPSRRSPTCSRSRPTSRSATKCWRSSIRNHLARQA